MSRSKSKNLFISHVHEDDSEVQKFKSLLSSKGYSVRDSSIDSTNPNQAKDAKYIKSGILAPGINWAGTLVVLISPNTHKSKWVDWEIEYAQKKDKRIVGVWIQGAKESDLPSPLDRYADAVVGWNAKGVMDAIRGKDNWINSDGTPREARSIARFNC